MSIPIQEIELVPSVPAFLKVFTHADCPRPVLSEDGTTQILVRPANDRLYCANCGLNLDDEADWAVRSSSHEVPGRARMMVHDFDAVKRDSLANHEESMDDVVELFPADALVESDKTQADPEPVKKRRTQTSHSRRRRKAARKASRRARKKSVRRRQRKSR